MLDALGDDGLQLGRGIFFELYELVWLLVLCRFASDRLAINLLFKTLDDVSEDVIAVLPRLEDNLMARSGGVGTD